MKKFLLGLLIGLGFMASTAYAVSTFNSNQLAPSPVISKLLQTNGTTSTWATLLNSTYLTWSTSTLGSISATISGLQPAGSYLTTVATSSPITGAGTVGSPLACPSCTINGVTSVSGTYPIVSSGGATPAISVTTGDLTLTSSNLSFGAGDGKKILLGTSTNITLAASPSFTNGTFTGTLSVSGAATLATTTISSTTIGQLTLSGLSNSIIAVNTLGQVIATTTSAGGVTAVSGSGSILSSGGSTPTIQLQNLTTADVLFGQGNNIIGTSSNFTFTTGTNNLFVTNSSTTNHTITGNLYLTGQANGCEQITNGVATSTGSSCGSASGGSGTISTSTNLTTNSIPIVTGAATLGNSSLSQSAGTTLINGTTPIIDGGGDWLSNVLQGSGANVIAQAATSTAVLGNLIQSGGVQYYQQTTYLTAAQFCSGGLYNIASTVPVTIYFPTLTQIGASPCGGAQPIASQFAAQYGVNTGSAAANISASGTGETLLYAAGSGPLWYPGMAEFATGQFIATSTISGATSTGMSFNAYIADLQVTSTQPSIMGQILSADSTGHGWQLTNLVSGSNISIATSTANQITLSVVNSPSFSGTLNVTGQTTLGNASTSALTVSGQTTLATTSVNGINISGLSDRSLTFASSTPDEVTGASFNSATYTIPTLLNPSTTTTLVSLYCITDTGTVLLNFNGSLLTCSSSGASSSPNATWGTRANVKVQIGTAASSPNWVTITTTTSHY